MTPFQQAFADARAAGKKEFTFNGKPYHTRLKGEKAGGTTKVSAERTAPPSRTAKATVSQTVRPETPAPNRRSVADIVGTAKRGLAKATGAGAIPTKTTTTVATTTGPKGTTIAALKANRKDFSRAGVEARKLATMTGPKVARKK